MYSFVGTKSQTIAGVIKLLVNSSVSQQSTDYCGIGIVVFAGCVVVCNCGVYGLPCGLGT